MSKRPSRSSRSAFDPRRRFVRLTQVRPDGLVEFDFAVGDPQLSVELILPAAAFREFCAQQGIKKILSVQASVPTKPAPTATRA